MPEENIHKSSIYENADEIRLRLYNKYKNKTIEELISLVETSTFNPNLIKIPLLAYLIKERNDKRANTRT